MKHLDDLPKRHRNHEIEDATKLAFRSLLARSDDFIIQGEDASDYGTDLQVEVVDRSHPTNVRIHVQLKGTEGALNADGSISVAISRANVNYLLSQPYSIFICYHLPTGTLWVRSADAVVRKYEHEKRSWTDQISLTVNFNDPLTLDRLSSLARLARSASAASRDARFAQTSARPRDVVAIIRAAAPHVHVPDDPAAAANVLRELFESGRADVAIGAAFDRFLAVLGSDHHAMCFAHMAEINLGMDGLNEDPERLRSAIAFLSAEIDAGRFRPNGLQYCIGNAYSALGREAEAAAIYEEALRRWSPSDGDRLRAQILKNLGGSHEKLGDQTRAVSLYREALTFAPDLAEAHHALGQHTLRQGQYAEALAHFDQVIFEDGPQRRRSAVPGWRVNALFNLGEGRAAFREIFGLLADATDEAWIWPWAARQVASFGRANDENARLSLTFWDRYLKAKPGCPDGTHERLLCILYLRQGEDYQGPDYQAFKAQFDAGIPLISGEPAAYLWDRLGHWAQDDGDWAEAERCFRHAYDLAGQDYGYCLGTALNFLGRSKDAVPLLLEQAERIQPDDKSWCQLASAYVDLGRDLDAAAAYEKAIALNPDNASAWFDLGGVHWNARRLKQAREIWSQAIAKFPDDELADRLRQDLPTFFGRSGRWGGES